MNYETIVEEMKKKLEDIYYVMEDISSYNMIKKGIMLTISTMFDMTPYDVMDSFDRE